MINKFMYHSSDKKNKEKILSEGLLQNQKKEFTIAGDWSHEIYGSNPIFLSEELGRFSDKDTVSFKVDVSDLNLVADLPSLIDFGAYIDESSETLYWNEGEEPGILSPYLDDGAISVYDFINNKEVIDAAIKLTKTAAYIGDIPAEKISVVGDREVRSNLIFNIIKISSTYYGKAGAGILIVCKEDNTCLLLKRSSSVEQPGTWGISGGAVSKDEGYYSNNDIKKDDSLDFEDTAFRESNEELFSNGILDIRNIEKEYIATTEFMDGNFKYKTFIYNVTLAVKKIITSNMSLNWENNAAKWFSLSSLPSNLHFGVQFTKDSLDEQGVEIFTDQNDELDWLKDNLNKIKDGDKSESWKRIFENFLNINRISYGKSKNYYDELKEQTEDTHKFILESSKILQQGGDIKKAREIFHLASKFLLMTKSRENKYLNKIRKSELAEHEGYLYHGTNFKNALSILSSGRFVPFGAFTRLSLSSKLSLVGKFGDIVFVFDAKKLQRKGATKMSYHDDKTREQLKKVNPDIDENYVKNPWISDIYKEELEWIMPLPFDFSKDDLVKIIIFKRGNDDDNAKLLFDYISDNLDVNVEMQNYPSYGRNNPSKSKADIPEKEELDLESNIKKYIGESVISINKIKNLCDEIYKEKGRKDISAESFIRYDHIRRAVYTIYAKINDVSSFIKKLDKYSSYHLTYTIDKIKEIEQEINYFKNMISDNYRNSDLSFLYGDNWMEYFKNIIDSILELKISDSKNLADRRLNIFVEKQFNENSDTEKIVKYFNNNSFGSEKEFYKKIKVWLSQNFNLISNPEEIKNKIIDYYNSKGFKPNDDTISDYSIESKISDISKITKPNFVPDYIYQKSIWTLLDSEYLQEISDERLKKIIIGIENKTVDDIIKYRLPYEKDESKICKLLIAVREIAKLTNEKIDFTDLDFTEEYLNNLRCN